MVAVTTSPWEPDKLTSVSTLWPGASPGKFLVFVWTGCDGCWVSMRFHSTSNAPAAAVPWLVTVAAKSPVVFGSAFAMTRSGPVGGAAATLKCHALRLVAASFQLRAHAGRLDAAA